MGNPGKDGSDKFYHLCIYDMYILYIHVCHAALVYGRSSLVSSTAHVWISCPTRESVSLRMLKIQSLRVSIE